jgi:tripartite-type tricarboxylate transporter receptor subunit TctC
MLQSIEQLFQIAFVGARATARSKGGDMKLPRRRLLQVAVGAAAFASQRTRAQSYPARPVRVVVGFAAGGPGDILARLLSPWLSDRLGQQFVVENRTGAGSNIATEMVARAPADGYTLLVVTPANVINMSLYERLGYDFLRDIAAVSGIVRVPIVMEVVPSFPARNVPEFIAHAKANLGKVNFASAGVGTVQHVTGELFKMRTGVAMTHVPYRGQAPAMTDLLAGQVQVMFDSMPASIGHIRAGRLRPLAVTTAARADALPDVPTVGDVVPGFEASSWFGLGAPAGTPPEIVERLNREVAAAFADPRIRARLIELGGMPLTGTAAEFARFMQQEAQKWAEVVRLSGAKAE